MSEALASEAGPLGIRVLIVEPGAFRTEFGAERMHRTSTIIGDYTATAGLTRTAVDLSTTGSISAARPSVPGSVQRASSRAV
jgi:NAD(P)-dependent dehydrogenase (short-subunit alcohol dehydrogenase family)